MFCRRFGLVCSSPPSGTKSNVTAWARNLIRAVDAAVDIIRANPRRYPLIHRDIRRAQVDRFPFGVFFIIRDDLIVVFRVVHLSRNPKHWKKHAPPKRRKLP